ncbi:MAG TPA: DUF5615 family PIN-like protein [Spirochaetota bacterium]|nr:DUF5615 family PIN-like protein [Spirochaetota bacterium]
MKFKFDENLPLLSVAIFRENGFDACSVRDQELNGCTDDRLLAVCTAEERILITLDLDFSDIRKYEPDALNGIIIIRPDKQDKNTIINILKRIIPVVQTEALKGKLMIVESDKIRIR